MAAEVAGFLGGTFCKGLKRRVFRKRFCSFAGFMFRPFGIA